MPVIRNPFKKNITAPPAETKTADSQAPDQTVPRSEVKTPAISILSQRDDEPNSYKLCVVNGSGEYLPPSPPEKKGFWKRSNSSTSFRREVREALRAADNEENFTISRESFDGYRRSFDISARSPVIGPQRPSFDSRTSRSSLDRPSLDRPGRTSLDRSSRPSLDALTPISPLRQSFDSRTGSNIRLPPAAVEETASDDENEFKDVDLNGDDNINKAAPSQPKKKGFLARFGGGDHQHHHSNNNNINPSSGQFDPEDKSRSRSSTLTWKKDVHQGSEELGNFQPDTQNPK